MKRWTPWAGAVVGAACAMVLVGGCSSSEGGSSGAPASTAASATSYAQCMRDHGVPMSDPDSATGMPHLDSSANPDSATLKAALQACQPLMPAGVRSSPGQQDLAAYLAYAQCMRANGLPGFPDPQPGPNGMFPDSGIDRNDPTFQKAANACASTLAKAAQ